MTMFEHDPGCDGAHTARQRCNTLGRAHQAAASLTGAASVSNEVPEAGSKSKTPRADAAEASTDDGDREPAQRYDPGRADGNR